MMQKKILFLMNNMEGYSFEIVKEMEQLGYAVTHLSDACRVQKNNLSFKEKIIKSLAKDFKLKFFQEKYKVIERMKFHDKINKLERNYDYIIDFAAGSNPIFMNEIFIKYSKSTKVLFIWDDLDYHEESKELISYFDRVYTYNKDDARKYNLIYRPSFFLNIFDYKEEIKEIDIFYFATMRETKRGMYVSTIDEFSLSTNNYIKLVHKLKFKDYLFRRNYLKFKKYYVKNTLGVYELAKLYKKSKVLLDISFTGQLGLGLRPIEAMASKCKLITTNRDILNYDFYNKNNIFVVDDNNFSEIPKFLELPYQEIPDSIKKNYSINKFLGDILSKGEA